MTAFGKALKQFFGKPWAAIVVLVVLALPGMWPLLTGQALAGHDMGGHYVKQVEYAEAWRGGQLSPDWASGLGFGNGYPLPGYYPPLLYAVGMLPYALSGNPILAVNLVVALFWLLSGLSMYLFLRRLTGRSAALLGATLYLYLPYRAVDVFVRGAQAEATVFVWLPLLFAAVHALFGPSHDKQKAGWFLGLAFAVAGLVLSHPVLGFAVAVALGFWWLWRWVAAQAGERLEGAVLGLAAGMGGLLLSAFYWLNLLSKQAWIQHERFLDGEMSAYAVHPAEWWTPGGELAMFLGWAWWGLLAVVAGGLLLRWRQGQAVGWRGLLFPSLLVGGGLWLTTEAGVALASWVEPLRYLQFPWRWMVVVSFGMAWLIGLGWGQLAWPKAWRVGLTTVGLLAVVGLGWQALTVNKDPSLQSAALTPEAIAPTQYQVDSQSEYLPVWVDEKPLYDPAPVAISRGQLAYNVQQNTGLSLILDTQSESAERVFVRRYYFPIWQVRVDGELVLPLIHPRYGLVGVELPAGEHRMELTYAPDPIRRQSHALTLVGAVMVGGLGWFLWSREEAAQ